MASNNKNKDGWGDGPRYNDEDLLNSSFEDSEVFDPPKSQALENEKADEFLVDAFPDPDFDKTIRDGLEYSSRKNQGSVAKIIVGIMVLLAVLAGTWYAFKADPLPMTEPQRQVVQANIPPQPIRPSASMANEPEADFSPSPETLAAEESRLIFEAVKKQGAIDAASEQKNITSKLGSKESNNSSTVKTAELKAGSGNKSKSSTSKSKTKASAVKSSEIKSKNKTEATKSAESGGEAKTAAVKSAESGGEAKTAAVKSAESGGEAKTEATKSANETKNSQEIAKVWVVNISSTPDADESMRLLSTVLGRDVGGQVYTYKTNVGGTSNYRIRVGFFDSKEEAQAIAGKIAADVKLSSTPWVVQPTVDEVSRMKSSK